ncbi:hypothetical protein Q0M94_17890 (plasmid) [Deinococcus radiomollis]|uniref:hypothetical protein n=1 Tax=Deinococcus radiomollis TaxID=468916 RepID=UPI003891856E
MTNKRGWGSVRVAALRAAVVARGETVNLRTAPEDMGWTAAYLRLEFEVRAGPREGSYARGKLKDSKTGAPGIPGAPVLL